MTHFTLCVIFLGNTLSSCILPGLKKYLKHKLYILCYEDFTLKNPKIPKKNIKTRENPRLKNSTFVGLVYKFKNATQLVWFGN